MSVVASLRPNLSFSHICLVPSRNAVGYVLLLWLVLRVNRERQGNLKSLSSKSAVNSGLQVPLSHSLGCHL